MIRSRCKGECACWPLPCIPGAGKRSPFQSRGRLPGNMVRDGLAPDEGIITKKLWALPMHRYASRALIPISAGSAVAKNIPGLDEAGAISRIERNAVAWRFCRSLPGTMMSHTSRPFPASFSRRLWLGRVRTIPMAKGASRFAQPQYIEQETRKILRGGSRSRDACSACRPFHCGAGGDDLGLNAASFP